MLKEFNQKQLITYISKEDKYDVIAFAITPWHALGVSAVIDFLVEKINRSLNCLIVICEHPNSGYALSDIHFNLNKKCSYEFVMRNNSRLNYFWKFRILLYHFRRLFLKFDDSDKKIYLLSSCMPITSVSSILSVKLNRGVINYYYDEGLLTYFLKLGGYLNLFQRVNYVYSFFFLKKREELPFTLFNYNGKIISKNENVIYYYRKQLEEKSCILDCDNLEGCVLICTQMYSFDGEIKVEDEMSIYNAIISYCKIINIGVKFKLHPRSRDIGYFDSIDKSMIYESNYSLEQILMKTKPVCVISMTSTVLINSLLFSGVKSISLCRILDFNRIGYCLRKDINSFVYIFSGIVDMPTSIYELNKLILKYACK